MTLYKYRYYHDELSRSRTKDILLNKRLYFSGIEAFNDPFDGQVYLDLEGTLHQVRSAQARVQYAMRLTNGGLYEGISMQQAIDLVNKNFTIEHIEKNRIGKHKLKRVQDLHNKKGVLALSSKHDNILMWSHYSFNHIGLCLGFDFSKEDSILNKCKKVRYQTHYEDIWSWLHTDEEIVEKILFTKSIEWQYEDEYRIVKDEVGFEYFKSESLQEVVFGCRMNESDKKEIVDICLSNGLNPKFRQTEIDLKRYKLNTVDYK
ncbi:Protein of unknown function [Parapedobacter luteus]|uniref:DUF2971 domain-containing protein n=1 Tax=Parapedobacter luteus TaxID=623280 RepID=A0A1T5CTH7_9SPHI|nr:DUF2971 domain-containing protein [Parapedobacter luteus]SKB62677.1 Protein of unknown function [Parapedobacter luteus]